MSAVLTRVRAELRVRLRGMVVLVLVVGVAGGAALTALAGARRTDSAVDRFLAYSRAPDANVGAEDPAVFERMLRLPQVVAHVEGAFMLMAPIDEAGNVIREGGLANLGALSAAGGDYGEVERPLLLAGRLPRADRADEGLINAAGSAATGLAVGDTLRMRGWPPEDEEALLRGTDKPPTGPVVVIHIVGVGRLPYELSTTPAAPGVTYTGTNGVLLPPGFYRAHHDDIAAAGGIGGSVRLHRGQADLAAFEAAARKLSPAIYVDNHTDDLNAAAKARHATRLEALALLAFGVLAGLVALAFVAQALTRQAFLDAAEYPALGAMGMTRGQLVAVASIRAAIVAVTGAAGAVALAYALSPRMPIGLGRQAEVDRGYSFDGPVLLFGGLAIVLFVEGAAALAAWRTARSAGLAPGPMAVGAEEPSRLVAGMSRAGVSPSAVVGVRMALEPGRGATAVPVRTTLGAAAVAILRTVGFVRRQVSAAIAWQATTVVVVGLVVGVPLGLAAGRWSWSLVADQLGVAFRPVVPVGVIALGVVGSLVLANAVAALPGLLAARTRPAEALRTE